MVDVSISVQTYNIQVNVTIPVPTVDTTFVQLLDANGIDNWEVKDIDGFSVAKIDSKGNLYLRGNVKRI